MLKKILDTIENKAQQEIDRVLQQKQERILKLEEKYTKLKQEKKQEKKQQLLARVKEELRNFKQKKTLEASFQVEERKKEILERVYDVLQQRINKLPLAPLEKLIAKMAGHIPDEKGKIQAGPKTAEILQQKGLRDIEIVPGLDQEGFVFVSPQLDVDMRLSTYLAQLREKTDPQVVKILFSEIDRN